MKGFKKLLNFKNPIILFSFIFLIFSFSIVAYFYKQLPFIFSKNWIDYVLFVLSCYLSAIVSSIWCKYSVDEMKTKLFRAKFNFLRYLSDEFYNVFNSSEHCKNDDFNYLLIISAISISSFFVSQKFFWIIWLIIILVSLFMKKGLTFLRYLLEIPKLYFVFNILNISQFSLIHIFFIVSFGSIIYYFLPRGVFGFELFTFLLFDVYNISLLKWTLFILFSRYLGTIALIPFYFLYKKHLKNYNKS